MKIDYVIVSSDDNPMYLDFWPIVRDLWSKIIGIKPIWVHISDEDKIIDKGDYIIHKIKKLDGINSGLQSQIARMYVTKFYEDKVCLTSDIDMLPISKEYFTHTTLPYNDDSIVILSSDAYPNKVRHPICYNAAKGKTFNEILDLNVSFREYCEKLIKFNWGWDTDELYFGKMLQQFQNKNRIIELNRGWTNGMANKRIDRAYWNYNENLFYEQYYIDSHSIRPYTQHKNRINKLLQSIYNGSKSYI